MEGTLIMFTKIIFILATSFLLVSCGSKNTTPISGDQIACTQDAKQCPDGTWVGRSGPKCEFVCPQ